MLISGRLRAALAGFAAVGLVVSHELAYLVAVPDPHERMLLRESTGHGYWHLAVIAAVAVLVWGCIRHVSGENRGEPIPRRGVFGRAAAFLAIVQVFGLALLEIAERVGVHHKVSNVFAEPAVVLGIVLALALAVVGALLFVLFARVVSLLLSRKSALEHGAAADPLYPQRRSFVRLIAPARGAGTLRGPPVPLSST
jgi:hypothetical protein